MHPLLGCWLAKDPLVLKAGPNTHGYVRNNPINRTDPSGLKLISHCPIDEYLGQYVSSKGNQAPSRDWVYDKAQSGAGTSPLRMEILARMINSSYEYRVAGSSAGEALANIKAHVETRVEILRLAEGKKYAFGVPNKFHYAKFPVIWYTANPRAFLDSINNGETAMGCFFATELTFFAGIGSWGTHSSKRTLSDISDIVPADWAYIDNLSNDTNRNPNLRPDPRWEGGLEGENVIYVGAGRFWGHFGLGLIVQTWEHWFEEIRGWSSLDGRLQGKPVLLREVDFPTVGLEN
jgi:hypothetical protein